VFNKYLGVLLLILYGCGGGEDSKPLPQPSCDVLVTWEAPTERLDGTPLNTSELSNFTIYISEVYDVLEINRELEVIITDVNLIAWEIKNVSKGRHYYYMTAEDKENHISAYSNIVESTC